MSVNVMQWCAGFGIFYNCIKNMKKYIRSNLPLPNCLTYVSNFFHCLFNSLIFIDLKGGELKLVQDQIKNHPHILHVITRM